ncbi:MAG: hypothetical protein ABL907_07970 [Hyphomicrobium sp.]
MLPQLSFTDDEAAQALSSVFGRVPWDAVALAEGFVALRAGANESDVARLVYEHSNRTLTDSRSVVAAMRSDGFLGRLTPRKRIGSAENPVTKLFPATVTEQRFLELLEAGQEAGRYTIHDEREMRHSLADFYLRSGDIELPINVKTASTQFARAKDLVGLDPEDCIPIPVYKASAAVEKQPSLLYLVSVDWKLVATIDQILPSILSRQEAIAWQILNQHEGSGLKKAEDDLVFKTVRKNWERFKTVLASNPFHAVSARRSLRIMHTIPKRTPGIGLRAWGTGASAEVNVHLSLSADTTPWAKVADRIAAKGLGDVVDGINRRRQEWVYDPEI